MTIEHFANLKNLIHESESFGLLRRMHKLNGFSGEKLTGSLQRLAKHQQSIGAGCYVEIGVFQGLSLLSVASVLDGTTAYGIDNFSQFDPYKANENLIKERAEDNDLKNYVLINSDYEDALKNLERFLGNSKIGLYFVDGPHDYRSQLICLQLVKPYLSSLSVIVVDDCNYEHVRLANCDFLLANPEFKLFFESYTRCHPANMDENNRQEAKKGWWNGVNIIVNDPLDMLDRSIPITTRDRRLHENEHLIHGAKYGVVAPEALLFVQSLLSFRLLRAFVQLVKIGLKLRKADQRTLGSYESLNTYSEELPQYRFNPKAQ